jgi:hypothetical protein
MEEKEADEVFKKERSSGKRSERRRSGKKGQIRSPGKIGHSCL